MQIAILCPDSRRAELEAAFPAAAGIRWAETPGSAAGADLLIDLLFDGSAGRLGALRAAGARQLWVQQAGSLPGSEALLQLAGWPHFLDSSIEIAGPEAARGDAEAAAAALGKRLLWVPLQPGLVTPRVIAMIINEAYHALSEGVSSKEAINTAMKLGTNYPFGPFEWAGRIGLPQVARLLQALAETDARYTPNGLLLREAGLPR